MTNLFSGAQSLIPVSVLTGFLGSGKTTVLNHLVHSAQMNRALVIINEFGAISLDHDLIARSSEDLVVEMMGGCLCCTIRGDLQTTLRDAPWRFARNGTCWFDRVIIETTGLADPAPILHTLMMDPQLSSLYRLDGVIATVDAAAGMATLDLQEEAVRQAAVADRILLTKTDLATPEQRAAIESRVRVLNPAAAIIPVMNGEADPASLFDCGLYNPATKSNDVQRWLAAEAYEGEHGHGHEHGDHDHHHHDVNRHDARIHASCLTFDQPLLPEAFERWIDVLMSFKGPDILRVKGILNLQGETKPVVIHGVQHIFHPPVRLDGWPSEDRRTQLVFITRGISADDLRGTLALLTLGLDQFGLQGLVANVPASGLLVETSLGRWT
jgi:G3E family GTPase